MKKMIVRERETNTPLPRLADGRKIRRTERLNALDADAHQVYAKHDHTKADVQFIAGSKQKNERSGKALKEHFDKRS